MHPFEMENNQQFKNVLQIRLKVFLWKRGQRPYKRIGCKKIQPLPLQRYNLVIFYQIIKDRYTKTLTRVNFHEISSEFHSQRPDNIKQEEWARIV